VTDHHRFLLKLHLEHYEQLEGYVERLNTRIERSHFRLNRANGLIIVL